MWKYPSFLSYFSSKTMILLLLYFHILVLLVVLIALHNMLPLKLLKELCVK